jgi:hypothetical protein
MGQSLPKWIAHEASALPLIADFLAKGQHVSNVPFADVRPGIACLGGRTLRSEDLGNC